VNFILFAAFETADGLQRKVGCHFIEPAANVQRLVL
jgi:hypothetical protein